MRRVGGVAGVSGWLYIGGWLCGRKAGAAQMTRKNFLDGEIERRIAQIKYFIFYYLFLASLVLFFCGYVAVILILAAKMFGW